MTTSPAVEVRRPHLTEREAQVLRLVAEGWTVSEIQPMLRGVVKRGAYAGQPPGRHAAQKVVEDLRLKLNARTLAQIVHHAHLLGFLGEGEVTLP